MALFFLLNGEDFRESLHLVRRFFFVFSGHSIIPSNGYTTTIYHLLPALDVIYRQRSSQIGSGPRSSAQIRDSDTDRRRWSWVRSFFQTTAVSYHGSLLLRSDLSAFATPRQPASPHECATIMTDSTASQAFCPPPFLLQSSFPSSGGCKSRLNQALARKCLMLKHLPDLPGRYCSVVPGIANGEYKQSATERVVSLWIPDPCFRTSVLFTVPRCRLDIP